MLNTINKTPNIFIIFRLEFEFHFHLPIKRNTYTNLRGGYLHGVGAIIPILVPMITAGEPLPPFLYPRGKIPTFGSTFMGISTNISAYRSPLPSLGIGVFQQRFFFILFQDLNLRPLVKGSRYLLPLLIPY